MARRNIVTLGIPQLNDDAVFLLSEKLTGVNARLAFVESLQAQILAIAKNALDQSLNPRTIKSVAIVDGHLIVTFSDGTTQDAGVIGAILYSLMNTLASSALPSAQVDGEPAIYASNYPALSVVKARFLVNQNRRQALEQRVAQLEA